MNQILSPVYHKLLLSLVLLASLAFAPLNAVAEPAIDANPVVNINQAGAEELAEALHGVGINKARAIVEDRAENGPFDSPEALARVRGIGDTTVSNNRQRIRTQ